MKKNHKQQKRKDIIDQHDFVLKGQKDAYYDGKVIASFYQIQQPPKGYIHPSMKQFLSKTVKLPIFNHDQKHFTPTFILTNQQLDEQHYLQKHNKKISQYMMQTATINVPKPRKKNYCQVCEQKFNTYKSHGQSTRHKKSLQKSKYAKRIQKLCYKFQKKLNRNQVQNSKEQKSQMKDQ